MEVIEAGLKYSVNIVSENAVARLSLNRFSYKLPCEQSVPIATEEFDNLDEAMQWFFRGRIRCSLVPKDVPKAMSSLRAFFFHLVKISKTVDSKKMYSHSKCGPIFFARNADCIVQAKNRRESNHENQDHQNVYQRFF